MDYKKILNTLPHQQVIYALETEIANAVSFGMLSMPKQHDKQYELIETNILPRWNHILTHTDINPIYKSVYLISLPIILHKYGFQNESMIKRVHSELDATRLIDINIFSAILENQAVSLIRRPKVLRKKTQYKIGDIISIAYGEKYYIGYIEALENDEHPIIEFYEKTFTYLPKLSAIDSIQAKGALYNDGIDRISKTSIHGLIQIPDPALQIHVIGSDPNKKPDNKHLAKSIGLYATNDILFLNQILSTHFLGIPI